MTTQFIGATRAGLALQGVPVLSGGLMVHRGLARIRRLHQALFHCLIALALPCATATEGWAGQITALVRPTIGRGILTDGDVATFFVNSGPTNFNVPGLVNRLTLTGEQLFGGPPSKFDVVLDVKATEGVTIYRVSDQVLNAFKVAPTDWTGVLL